MNDKDISVVKTEIGKGDIFHIGCHLSSSGGFVKMVNDMEYVGGNTFQYFSRNPRGSRMKALDMEDIEKFLELREVHGIKYLLAHAPYTLNPCSDKESVREFAEMVLEEDIARMELIPGSYYNFHPGSHVGQGSEKGIEIIAEALNRITDKCMNTKVLLETMAGKGTEVGRTFEEISEIIRRVENSENIGVCLDTCHIYDAGYDIRENLNHVLEDFNKTVGLDRLYAIHLNDSKNPMGSGKDRHENIGEGSLGIETISSVINHPLLRNLPFYLETPNDNDGHREEITLLKSMRK